ncbi:MAG: hypothetical protein KKF67_00195 [Nanoarchaeota archaeon]|nr:hypothetical protein [Nanoarchaeota archaeon]
MLTGMFLEWYGYYGGGKIGEVLNQWQDAGIFSLLLPFLLIFALVYGILDKTKIFENNKAISPIIGFVVALISLQFEMVPRFFSEIFPRLGIGLVIFLVALILLGMLAPNKSWMTYTFFGIGAIILIVILVKTAGALNWSAGYWWSENWPIVAGAVFILAILGVIVAAANPSTQPDVSSPLMKALHGLTGTNP